LRLLIARAMNIHDLQLEKINLINWITRLQDEAIIAKLRKIQSKENIVDFPSLSDQEIMDQAKLALKQIKEGKTTTQANFRAELLKN
jgi:hypothetical protein